MTHRGWVSLYRKFTEHYLYPTQEQRPFTKAEAWLDLILTATHQQYKHSVYGNLVILERGDLLISERHLSNRWKWSRDRVRLYLNQRKQDKMITLEPAVKKYDRNGTRLHITNYNTFQPVIDPKTSKIKTTHSTTSPTTHSTTGDTTSPTNNNNSNNINNSNKKNSKKEQSFNPYISILEECMDD